MQPPAIPRLTPAERAAFAQAAPAWQPVPGRDAIARDFRFADFPAAWAFMTRVAALAEQRDHHPDWSNTFNRVRIVLTTHDAGGLTARDTDLARAIDAAAASPPPPALAAAELTRLLDVMARLRAPDGCPWDREQTFATIAPYTIEEAYEVADAIARDDMEDLPDELGDLLFQVVYYAQMGAEAGHFDFAAVARTIADKMIRRHPHVFADAASAPSWEDGKRRERATRQRTGTLDGIAAGLPALTRAGKITNRVARVGFDWPDAEQVLQKLEEEIAEVRAELPTPAKHTPDPARLADEVGDVLFVAANLARKLGLDPETCLRGANDKFSRRFGAVERRLAAVGLPLADAGLARLEAEWQAVKAAERAEPATCPTPVTPGLDPAIPAPAPALSGLARP